MPDAAVNAVDDEMMTFPFTALLASPDAAFIIAAAC